MKKNLFFLTLATAVTIPALVISTPVHADNSAGVKKFKDIPSSHAYYNEISEMTSKGIIHGYENGMFKPNELITRQHAAALLARAFKPSGDYTREFTDMSTKNSYYKDMVQAVGNGWLEAPNGKARPSDTITRGEMAIALSRAAGLTDERKKHGLKDVSSKYAYAVTVLVNSKVTTGFEDNTFRENKGLSRAHYSAFLYRTLNYKAGITESEKGSIYGSSYIGKYGAGKVPTPVGVTYEIQVAEYDKLVSLMPKGAYHGKLSAKGSVYYDSVLNQIEKASGISKVTIAGYIDESAKIGRIVYFDGNNGKKYFVSYQYSTHGIMVGEDHR
ncbi:S-layer homology domain-containing protein [Sporosarcina sp. FSL K6-1508]|uniref:S-layer homology domain-containing protein n=1 Tax=Sporosarcina sp. FSL K6-1508 TaxID=2921553 RepID=UPI0030F73F99